MAWLEQNLLEGKAGKRIEKLAAKTTPHIY
jgi:hypothetical protein